MFNHKINKKMLNISRFDKANQISGKSSVNLTQFCLTQIEPQLCQVDQHKLYLSEWISSAAVHV